MLSLRIRGDNLVHELDVLSLSCSVLASPAPVISWLKRSEGRVIIILNSTRISITNQYRGSNSTSSILTIARAVPSDTGQYVCEAKNGLDTAVVERSVTVPGLYIHNIMKIMCMYAVLYRYQPLLQTTFYCIPGLGRTVLYFISSVYLDTQLSVFEF